jgi:hypothetical protein
MVKIRTRRSAQQRAVQRHQAPLARRLADKEKPRKNRGFSKAWTLISACRNNAQKIPRPT